ncbi:MAG: DUF1707 domain-containing protein [Streptosporangiales bacterium]|nr:DUF1707 domain-containing protein [Streptosporangiales bacterium]
MTMREATAGAQSGLRASDAERERTVEALRKHYETGHIGYAEFNHRMERAYAATYLHELTALAADLPGAASPGNAVAPARQAQKPKERTGAVKVLAIIALVIASLVGLSWLGNLLTAHPLITILAAAAVIWIVLKKPYRRKG